MVLNIREKRSLYSLRSCSNAFMTEGADLSGRRIILYYRVWRSKRVMRTGAPLAFKPMTRSSSQSPKRSLVSMQEGRSSITASEMRLVFAGLAGVFSGLSAHLLWKVDISDVEDTAICVVIQHFCADHLLYWRTHDSGVNSRRRRQKTSNPV